MSCTNKLKSKNKPKRKPSKRRRRIPRIRLADQLQQQVQQLQTNYERQLQLNTTEIRRLTELLAQPGEQNVLQQRIDELVGQ